MRLKATGGLMAVAGNASYHHLTNSWNYIPLEIHRDTRTYIYYYIRDTITYRTLMKLRNLIS